MLWHRSIKQHALCAALGAIYCWTAQTVYLAWSVQVGSRHHSPTTEGLQHFFASSDNVDDVAVRRVNSTYEEDPLNNERGQYPVIDAVFTYVNGSDPALQAQMRAFGKEVEASRIRDFGQLRYTMRSAFVNAPFIRNFFVVVSSGATQIPSWLNASHPRIRIVEHAEIWDNKSDLPSANSNAIEWATMNIPGIAPLYLLFNDDTAIMKPLKLSYIWPGPNQYVLHEAWVAPRRAPDVAEGYGKSLAFVYGLLNKRYGFRKKRMVASHVPILLNTTVMRMIRDEWPEEFRNMYRSKPFRTNMDLQTQFTYQQYVKHNFPYVVAPSKHVHYISDVTEGGLLTNQNKLKNVKDSPLQYICMQDQFKGNPMARVMDQIRGFYEELFPWRAPWETNTVRPSSIWRQVGNNARGRKPRNKVTARDHQTRKGRTKRLGNRIRSRKTA